MPSVNIDEIDGLTASHHIIAGYSITRKATVTGIVPSGTQDTGQFVAEALAAVEAITGPRGTPCPGIPVATYLEQFTIDRVVHTDSVKIGIIYRGYPRPRFEFRGGLSDVQTNKDAGGNLISTSYQYPSGYLLDHKVAGQKIQQGGLVTRKLRQPCYTIHFTVGAGTISGSPADATTIVTYLKDSYEGYINASNYAIGHTLGLPHQWLITSVDSTSADGGITYQTSFTFELRLIGWDPLVTFVDPNTGKPPPDITSPSGYYSPQIQGAVVFPTFIFDPN